MGIFGDYFDPQYSGPAGLQFSMNSLLSALSAAQYRPTSAAAFPNPAAGPPDPASLPIPRATPPIFLSPPAGAAPLPIPRATPPIFLPPPDPAAAAAMGSAPPAQPVSAQDGIGPGLNNGLNNGINNGITNHALTLLALGAGIAQGGVGKGLALASTAAEAERNRAAQQLNFLQTYKALTDGGVPPQEARAAISNPSLMRALAAKYLGARSQGNAAGAAANVPPVPPNVAGGAAYSPSRDIWKDRDGNLFDQQGKPVP